MMGHQQHHVTFYTTGISVQIFLFHIMSTALNKAVRILKSRR